LYKQDEKQNGYEGASHRIIPRSIGVTLLSGPQLDLGSDESSGLPPEKGKIEGKV